jgi:hypothetical protein
VGVDYRNSFVHNSGRNNNLLCLSAGSRKKDARHLRKSLGNRYGSNTGQVNPLKKAASKFLVTDSTNITKLQEKKLRS